MNPHESAAREEKCRKIARLIIAQSLMVLRSGIGDDTMWNALAQRAGVNVPSDVSRKRVIEILEGIAL